MLKEGSSSLPTARAKPQSLKNLSPSYYFLELEHNLKKQSQPSPTCEIGKSAIFSSSHKDKHNLTLSSIFSEHGMEKSIVKICLAMRERATNCFIFFSKLRAIKK